MKEPNNFEETVPGRPTAAELRAMALRQQQQIDSQHQLLAAKEQRLRFLKTQDARGAAAAAEGERLRRLRERVEAQESKLRRLRALRGQVDLQKTYNVTLSNDLDSIRALFSEKEKELSLAVAKVEALTRQLEELRRDRRGPFNLIQGNGLAGNNGAGGNGTTGNNQQLAVSPAARELEKLRRELMYRNQLSLQQDARLHIQREALQQRQAELRSVDQRILELQTRLQKKKASNLLISQTSNNNNSNNNNAFLNSNHNSNNNQATINLSLSKLSTNANTILQQNINSSATNNNNNNSSSTQPSQLPKLQTGSNLNGQLRKSTNIYPQQRVIPRGNVAAIEPFNHSPQKIQAPTVNNAANVTHSNVVKPAHQLIQDLANSKLNALQYQSHHQQQQINAATIQQNHHQQSLPESDENKLARKLQKIGGGNKEILDDDANLIEKISDGKFQTLPYNTKFNSNNSSNNSNSTHSNKEKINECDSEKAGEIGNGQTVHSTPLVAVNKSIAVVPQTATTPTSDDQNGGSHIIKPALKSKMFMKQPQPHQHHQVHHQIPSGNAVVPPRKPISSVAPTIAPKINPKIHVVQPISTSTSNNNNNSSSSNNSNSNNNSIHHNDLDSDKQTVPVSPRPALPPKPNKAQNNQNNNSNNNNNNSSTNHNSNNNNNSSDNSNSENVPTIINLITKSQSVVFEPQHAAALNDPNINQLASIAIQDNLPIKARPLTIKKQPFHEQPKLKNFTSGIKPIQYTSRRIEMPPSFLFPEIERVELKDRNNDSNQSSIDETDKANIVNNDTISTTSSSSSIPSIKEENGGSGAVINGVIKRRQNGDMTKIKLSRRVSFDPLALLLDASLEGELELVKKTAMQVANPSAANDEGITALHNAICAGHLEIVKFLVEFGCDVNAQDSDGWTPLHCAASCNNLTMVKFLVESGACLFAATLSDHETPAEKCEEDEEGFDGCSEYLYSIQEKLGILNNGEVYAVFAYDAQQSDELSFTVNDCLTILRKGDDSEREWWWARNAENKEGYVPRNLFGLYPRVPLSNQTE